MQTHSTYIQKNIQANRIKTILLLGGTFLLITLVGYGLSVQYNNFSFLYGALLFSGLLNFVMYWFSASIALKSSGAIAVDRQTPEGRALYSTVEKLARYAQLKTPGVYIIPDTAPNAFATGRNEHNSAVAVTEGLIQLLSQEELEGVIAHELAHIGNKDILISSVISVLAGVLVHLAHITLYSSSDREKGSGILGILAAILAPIAATLIQLAVSRSREFQADATAAQITKNPEALATALEKIHAHNHIPLTHATQATAHMYIANPLGEEAENHTELGKDTHSKKETSGFAKLFMTHPPVEERTAKLRGL